MSILRLLLTIVPGSAPYHQFSLPAAASQDITLCSYFPAVDTTPDNIAVISGNGTPGGFVRALRDALGRRRYDVVHAHSPHVGLLFLLTRGLLPRRPPVRLVYTVHSSWPNYRASHRAMLVPVFLCFDRIVCCSRASRDSLPGWFRRLAGDRLTAIPNGVDLGRIDRSLARRAAAGRGTDFTIVWVGRLTRVKRPHRVLDVFRRLTGDGCRLVLVGDGELRGDVERAVDDWGLRGRVRITGAIEREAVYDVLAGADVFVSTSDVEGLPVAVLEAMACGCPVVLSDIPSHREIAGGAGFVPLVGDGGAGEFATRIEELRRLDPDRRRRLGADCRALVEERFSLDRMHRLYREVYRDVSLDDA